MLSVEATLRGRILTLTVIKAISVQKGLRSISNVSDHSLSLSFVLRAKLIWYGT